MREAVKFNHCEESKRHRNAHVDEVAEVAEKGREIACQEIVAQVTRNKTMLMSEHHSAAKRHAHSVLMRIKLELD